MPTNVVIYIGAVAPSGIRAIIDPPTGNPNILQTCSAVTFDVKPPTGPNVDWSAQILTRDPLVAEYQFGSGDVSAAGTYKIVPRLMVLGGTIDAELFTLTAVDPYA